MKAVHFRCIPKTGRTSVKRRIVTWVAHDGNYYAMIEWQSVFIVDLGTTARCYRTDRAAGTFRRFAFSTPSRRVRHPVNKFVVWR
ncbi:unnamed protein product [Larinioides sclopetarius]|uniref:Uncharacterized protein n=1 Tax=Larinioides sclopetarius TaxID=280406 RepID=A0AAV2AGG5_9ARAC